MEFSGIDWVVISIAVSANMLLGSFWFGLRSRKVWQKELSRDQTEVPNRAHRFLVLFGYALVISIVFWFYLPSSPDSAISTANTVWFFFFALPTIVGPVLSRRQTAIARRELFFFWVSFMLASAIVQSGLR